VAAGATLTISPGVLFKVDEAKSFLIEGTLIARGTSTSPIIFTTSSLSPLKIGLE